MMPFFDLSKRLFDDFAGIRGNNVKESKISIYYTSTKHEAGKITPIITNKVKKTRALITDLSNREKMTYNEYLMQGRKLISVRFIIRDTIEITEDIDKLIEGLSNVNSYVIIDFKKYNIIEIIPYINNNMCRLICAYGG